MFRASVSEYRMHSLIPVSIFPIQPLGQVVVGLGLLFGNGAASYISRLPGRGDKENTDKVASTAFYSSVSAGALNIALDPLFIYAFDLCVAGAEIATAISQVVSTCVYLTCIFRKKAYSIFGLRTAHIQKKPCLRFSKSASRHWYSRF